MVLLPGRRRFQGGCKGAWQWESKLGQGWAGWAAGTCAGRAKREEEGGRREVRWAGALRAFTSVYERLRVIGRNVGVLRVD